MGKADQQLEYQTRSGASQASARFCKSVSKRYPSAALNCMLCSTECRLCCSLRSGFGWGKGKG